MAGGLQDAGSASEANAIDVETIAFDSYCECVMMQPFPYTSLLNASRLER